MKFEKTEVHGFGPALRGMRNPLESWHKSDSVDCGQCTPDFAGKCPYVEQFHTCVGRRDFMIGEHDMDLCQRLVKGGSEQRKFLRQIMAWADITAPLYWWKEFDTYKVGTTANSTSTMHKLATTPITLESFEIDDYDDGMECLPSCGNKSSEFPLGDFIQCAYGLIDMLEHLRLKYLETKDKRYWKELIRWLPESWLQTRTVSMSYENVLRIYKQRQGHKLSEWKSFCDWAEMLPRFKELCLAK